jgi:site-specific recombinase XerD
MVTKPSWAQVNPPLAEYVEGFRSELESLGYTPLVAATHVRLMAHLSRWMDSRGLEVGALGDDAVVEAYFADRRAAGYTNERTTGALRPLVAHLRRRGVLPPPTPLAPATPCGQLLDRFRGYLLAERGLAAATADLNVHLVRPFLTSLTSAGTLVLDELTAADVTAFVVDQAHARPRSIKRIVTALRSLLGFLYVEGEIDQALAQAVPAVAAWTLSGLPKALRPAEVDAMLASCDPLMPRGRRDLAILMLLARLGLRAGEVAALGLDDIDWRRGEVTVRGKGNRHDLLPLPDDVGAKVVSYLRHGRPPTAQGRTVFVRVQAPHRPLTQPGITTIVADAGRRSGLGTIGAHRLRHSAATAMLRSGASLDDIGRVLRHRRWLTTALYAKVDLDALRPLTRPWPGDPR